MTTVDFKSQKGVLRDTASFGQGDVVETIYVYANDRFEKMVSGSYQVDLSGETEKMATCIEGEEVSAEEYEKRLAMYVGDTGDWEEMKWMESIDEAFTDFMSSHKE